MSNNGNLLYQMLSQYGPGPSGAPADGSSLMPQGTGVLQPGGGPGYTPNWLDKLTGYTDANGIEHGGYGQLALGGFTGLANLYMGLKNFGLAEDMFKENKRQFNLNFEAQRSLTNTSLRDRQAARVASNPTAYQSVGDYMKDNGI